MHFCSVLYDLWYKHGEILVSMENDEESANFHGMSQAVHVGQILHLVIVQCILTISQTKPLSKFARTKVIRKCKIKIVIWKMCYVNVALFSCVFVQIKLFSELAYACMHVGNCGIVYTIPPI